MQTLDIIILICFIPALIQGLRKGFISQIIALVSVIAGVWLAFRFTQAACDWLSGYITDASTQVMHIIAFVLIFTLVTIVLNLAGRLLTKIIKLALLGWADKLLGLFFSLVKGALIIGLLILAFDAINGAFGFVSEDKVSESVLYSPLREMADKVFPYIKALFAAK